MPILYIYKDNFCDPLNNVGTAKLFGRGTDADEYLRFFVASMNPSALKRYRAFITNDNVEFHEVDHYVLMEDNFELDALQKGRIEEVNLYELAAQFNTAYKEKLRQEQGRKLAAKKAAETTIRKIKSGEIKLENEDAADQYNS